MGGISATQFGVLAAVQVLGLISAALARMAEGRAWQAWSQRLFLGLLFLVGFTTILALTCAPQQWMMSATTLTVMVVAAVCDFNHPL